MSAEEEVCVWLASELHPGCHLLLAYENIPFQMAPLRAEVWEAGRDLPKTVWGRVTRLLTLTDNDRWWVPPVYRVVVLCDLPLGASLITAVDSNVPVVLRPEPPVSQPPP